MPNIKHDQASVQCTTVQFEIYMYKFVPSPHGQKLYKFVHFGLIIGWETSVQICTLMPVFSQIIMKLLQIE